MNKSNTKDSGKLARIERKLNKLLKIEPEELETRVEEENPNMKKLNGLLPWIPWKAKVGKRKAKKGYIIVQKVYENGNMDFERHLIQDGTIMVDGIPRLATTADVFHRGKKPWMILPMWSIKPFSRVDHFTETEKANYTTKGWRLILNRIKNEAITEKKKIGSVVIWIVLVAIAGLGLGYMAYKGGWF